MRRIVCQVNLKQIQMKTMCGILTMGRVIMASNHMTGDRRYFDRLDEKITGKVRFGDDSRVDIKGKCTISFIDLNGISRTMTDVYYIPDLKSNIVSLGQATESGCDIRLKGEHLTMCDHHGKLLVKAERSKNRLYKVQMKLRDSACLYLTSMSEASTWHPRMGYVNMTTLTSMIDKELVQGAPKINLDKEVCSSCLLGKQTPQMFPQATTYPATKMLELIHEDLCGPITPSTSAGNRYIFVLNDDYTRYIWTILLKEKGDAFCKFKNFKAMVEGESGEKIQSFRKDRGEKFVPIEFNSFCEKLGIKRHLTAPYTPQHNGVVERRNRTMMEMTRSVLKHMHMPNYLWGEAIRHSTYLLNQILTRALKEKTPYECFRGKKPSIDHIRIFGCIAYAKVDKPHLKKLDDRSRILIHLGKEPGSIAYRLLDPETKRIVVSRDVVFDESKGWEWKHSKESADGNGSFTITFSNSGNHGLHESETITHENAETGESIEETDPNDLYGDDNESKVVQEEEQEHITESVSNSSPLILRRTQRQINNPKYLNDYVLLVEEEGETLLFCSNNEPRNFHEAKESKEWTHACEEEMRSIEKFRVWDLVDLSLGVKPTWLKWVFKLKKNSD